MARGRGAAGQDFVTEATMPRHNAGGQPPIFVRATGCGSAGIATLVLDGDDAGLYLNPVFICTRPLTSAATGELLLGRLVDGAGRTVDEVMAAPLGKKDSETGNAQVELSCHGGQGAVFAVEEALLAAGFARGRGTELMERAHLNGRLSLIEIEARVRLSAAATARQAEFLLGHAQFRQRWERLGFDMAMGMRSNETAWRGKLLQEARAGVARQRAAAGLLAQHHVALVGPVNAGKSTLGNRLARADRHIVSAVPGTTLDRLDTPVEVRGLSVLLTDTAGWGAELDDVEREAQRRGQEAAQSADLRLVVLDGSAAPGDRDAELVSQCVAAGPVLLVLNKRDLGVDESAAGLGFLAGREPCVVSATTGEGFEGLLEGIERVLLGGTEPAPGAPFTRRHAHLQQQLADGLEKGVDGSELLMYLRRLVGTRPNPDELAVALGE
ncbi:MAG: GTP-binding protein [Planctomycetota bacterium]|nr:GTP-binding protein [Planctomycetota bacterium]